MVAAHYRGAARGSRVPARYSSRSAKLLCWKASPYWGAWCQKPNGRMLRELFYQKYRLIYRVVSETEMLMLTLHPALRPLAAGSRLE